MSEPCESNESGGRQSCLIPMDRIVPNPDQPRKEFDEYKLMELASSIRQYGLLQPVTVRARGEAYELIMGERRFRACRMLGFSHIDAFILPVTGEESAILALVENLQREDLHFFEEAEAYSVILSEGMTQEALARRLGKSPACVANKLRLLHLSPEVRQYILDADLTERHARALLRLPEGEARLRIARSAGEKHLTVRETENLVSKALQRLPVPPLPRRIVSLARDPRLYLNAIRTIVEQMKQSGVEAQMLVSECENTIELRVILPKRPRGMKGTLIHADSTHTS